MKSGQRDFDFFPQNLREVELLSKRVIHLTLNPDLVLDKDPDQDQDQAQNQAHAQDKTLDLAVALDLDLELDQDLDQDLDPLYQSFIACIFLLYFIVFQKN